MVNYEHTTINFIIFATNGDDYEYCPFIYSFPVIPELQNTVQALSNRYTKLIPKYIYCTNEKTTTVEMHCTVYKKDIHLGFSYNVSDKTYAELYDIFGQDAKVETNANGTFALLAIRDLVKNYTPTHPLKIN